MTKVIGFLNNIRRSLTDVSFYKNEVTKKSLFSSYRYLYWLHLFILLFTAALLMVKFLAFYPDLGPNLARVKPLVSTLYPADLVITFKDSKLQTNQPNPVHLDLNPAVTGLETEKLFEGEYDHFITIDTHATVEDYPKISTLVLATSDALIFPDRNSTRQIVFFSEINQQLKENDGNFNLDNFRIDKDLIQTGLSGLDTILQKLPRWLLIIATITAVTLPFFGSIFAALGSMFTALIFSFVGFFVAKILSGKADFSLIYKQSLYAFTAPLILHFAFPNLVNFWVQLGLYVLTIGLIYKKSTTIDTNDTK